MFIWMTTSAEPFCIVTLIFFIYDFTRIGKELDSYKGDFYGANILCMRIRYRE